MAVDTEGVAEVNKQACGRQSGPAKRQTFGLHYNSAIAELLN
jgi:hypothetical protein